MIICGKEMKTKVLLGSVGVVTILILVSFTNVVSVQSTTTSSVTESPLFSIRTHKATDTENNRIITSDYLGKGTHTIQFPLRDTRTEQIQTIIEIINKMDDSTFSRFQSIVLSHFCEEKNTMNIDATQLVDILKQLKTNSKELTNIHYQNENDIKNTSTISTCFPYCGLTYFGPPFCLIVFFLQLILVWPLFILLIIQDLVGLLWDIIFHWSWAC